MRKLHSYPGPCEILRVGYKFCICNLLQHQGHTLTPVHDHPRKCSEQPSIFAYWLGSHWRGIYLVGIVIGIAHFRQTMNHLMEWIESFYLSTYFVLLCSTKLRATPAAAGRLSSF